MSDYELQLKIKNAHLLNLMRENGYPRPPALARAMGISRSSIDRLLLLKTGVYHPDGSPKEAAQRIANFLHVHIEELVPASHLRDPLLQNTFTTQVAEQQMKELAQTAQDPAHLLEVFETESRDAFGEMVKMLSPRDAEVVRMKFEDDMSYEEIGEKLGVSTARVYQLYHRAIRKLRHPTNHVNIIKASGVYASKLLSTSTYPGV